jgi:hypothetical protein
MKTAEQRKEEFMQELQQLCIKHQCELSLSDNGKPYGMHSPILVMCFDGIYSSCEQVIEEFGCFELDSFYISSQPPAQEQSK